MKSRRYFDKYHENIIWPLLVAIVYHSGHLSTPSFLAPSIEHKRTQQTLTLDPNTSANTSAKHFRKRFCQNTSAKRNSQAHPQALLQNTSSNFPRHDKVRNYLP